MLTAQCGKALAWVRRTVEGTGEGFPEEVTSELSVDWLVEANQIGMCVWNEAGYFWLRESLGKDKEM